MSAIPVRKVLILTAIFVGCWLGLRYLLPVFLPFFMGLVIALAAEPAVKLGTGKLGLPRAVAAGIGVSLTLILMASVLWLLGAIAVKELGQLAGAMPDIQSTVGQGLTLLQDWLIGIADRAPDGLRVLLIRLVTELFGSSAALLGQITSRLPGILRFLFGWIPDGAVGLATGILAGFMISARLPQIRTGLTKRVPQSWQQRYLPALQRVRRTMGGWIKAQFKLMAVTYGIVAVGLLLTGVPYSFAWAVLVAAVDAVPVLGTGTVLIPWALILLLKGQSLQAVGLICTYAAALLTRTVLEPRLVGRQIGLDPLTTLIFFYGGFKLWGVPGMLLAPMLAAAVKSLTDTGLQAEK